MKKKIFSIVASLIVCASCNTSSYNDEIKNEREELQEEYRELKEEYDELRREYRKEKNDYNKEKRKLQSADPSANAAV